MWRANPDVSVVICAYTEERWDDLIAAGKALTKDGRFGFAITGGGEVGNTIFRSLPFIWMNGGGIVSDDLKTATLNQPAAVEAVTFYTDFFKNGISPTSNRDRTMGRCRSWCSHKAGRCSPSSGGRPCRREAGLSGRHRCGGDQQRRSCLPFP